MDENLPVVLKERELVLKEKETEALTVLANSMNAIANFVTQGGLTQVLSGYARSQAVKEILGGLAAHDGREALDARVLKQNAVEIVQQVEAVFDKYKEKVMDKTPQDPDIHDGEAQFKAWVEKKNNEA